MAQFIERLKSIDRRIVAVVGAIPILMCLCCFGIFLLTPTDVEPTAAVALNTATGELAETQEPTNTAEPTGTADQHTQANQHHSPDPIPSHQCPGANSGSGHQHRSPHPTGRHQHSRPNCAAGDQYPCSDPAGPNAYSGRLARRRADYLHLL
jgi:hypothetical protein